MSDSNPHKARIYLVKRIVIDMEGPIEEVVGVDLQNSVDLMQQKIDALNKQEEAKKKELVDFLAGKVKEVVELIVSDKTFLFHLSDKNSYDDELGYGKKNVSDYLKDKLNLSSFNIPNLVDHYNLDNEIGIKFFTLLDYLQQECNVIRGLEKIKFFRSPFPCNYFSAVRIQQAKDGNIDWLQFIEYFVNREFKEYFCTYKFQETDFIVYDSINRWVLNQVNRNCF